MRAVQLVPACLILILATAVRAEGGCPPGEMPYNATAPMGSAQSMASCGPIPSNTPARQWSSRWGALADDGAGSFGSSANESSKKRAEKSAVADCKARGGTKCAVYMTYRDQCIALASSDVTSTTARAPDETSAQQDSLAGCKRGSNGAECRVHYSGCSLPARSR